MGDIQITENMWLSEFICPCCGLDKINYGIIHRLQVIRDFLNGVIILPEEIKIIVLSGVRCKPHNRSDAVGGKKSSRHLRGCDREEYKYPMEESDATDFTLSVPEYLPLVDYVFGKTWTGGWKFYKSRGFIHQDLGEKRRF